MGGRILLVRTPGSRLWRWFAYVRVVGTHFRFIKEIPLFARYEMRVRIAAWDEKWVSSVRIFGPSTL